MNFGFRISDCGVKILKTCRFYLFCLENFSSYNTYVLLESLVMVCKFPAICAK